MTDRNTTVRSLHDLGLSAWFGGSLMGAVGLNGAAADAEDPAERLRLSALGWKRWAPVSAVAILMHGVGGAGLVRANRDRVKNQEGTAANTTVKLLLTLVAAGVTAYSGVLGAKVEEKSHEGGRGATEPTPGASSDLASAQLQLKIAQWATPALTGILVVLSAQQGEQQKPSEQILGRFRKQM